MGQIGFKRAKQEQEQAQTQEENLPTRTEEMVQQIRISDAHMSLQNKIKGILSVVGGTDFGNLPTEQRHSYIITLVDSVALDSELTVKNALLRGE